MSNNFNYRLFFNNYSMSIFRMVTFIICFHVFSALAVTVDCEPSTSGENNYNQWSSIHVPFELKASTLTMTLGSNIPDWTILYTAKADIGMAASTCHGSSIYMYYTLLSQEQSVGQQGLDIIYSTDVPGIGVSVSSDYQSNASVPVYPSTIYWTDAVVGQGFWATIKYWKIPGQIPMNGGPITVTGPEAAVVYMSWGTTFTSSSPDRITSDGNAYISSSRILTTTLMFQPGTCNIVEGDIKVNMGKYNGSGSYSDWKDASFKLVCPNGLGYNGSASSNSGYDYPYALAPNATTTANNKQNGRVRISIVPYTEVIDANKGIIALDGTGAKGYGIQLAWGYYGTQNAIEPANPVILNSYVDANSLNSGFAAGDTPIGGNAFSGTDNTIKMAARYIRTEGETAPGPANAVVQVIANYE